jgi:hypothetical protein
MSTIVMQFSAGEAIALMRVLAIGRRKATSIDERDDLEMLYGRIYDQMYRRQQQSPTVASGDALRTPEVEILPFSTANQTRAKSEPASPQSWRKWHPSLTAAACVRVIPSEMKVRSIDQKTTSGVRSANARRNGNSQVACEVASALIRYETEIRGCVPPN